MSDAVAKRLAEVFNGGPVKEAGMELRDLMYEIAAALDTHESDGATFQMDDFDAHTGNGEIEVATPDGETRRFRIRVTELPA